MALFHFGYIHRISIPGIFKSLEIPRFLLFFLKKFDTDIHTVNFHVSPREHPQGLPTIWESGNIGNQPLFLGGPGRQSQRENSKVTERSPSYHHHLPRRHRKPPWQRSVNSFRYWAREYPLAHRPGTQSSNLSSFYLRW